MDSRTAIVTGASRGLGLALTTELAARGWHVIADGRDADALHTALDPLGPSVVALPGDIADPAHRAELAAAAGDRVDLLVNNAGALGPSPLPHLAELSLDDFASLIGTNVVAQLGVIQATLPALRAAHGTVIDVTSDAAVEPYEGWGGYGASKAALEHLGAVLAVEEPDVGVLTIDPGDMRTRMHQDAFPGEDISDRPPPEDSVPGILAYLDGSSPSGRYRARS
jgi:NAD(P)-dependent dehydrogenase (short-subunit alcohol dehydrogenase family)